MSSIEVTITSKNQITLPIAYVRNMHLAKNRTLQAKLVGNKLILAVPSSLEERLGTHWQAIEPRLGKRLTEPQLSAAIRQAAGKRASA